MAKILMLVPDTQSAADMAQSLRCEGYTCTVLNAPAEDPQSVLTDLPALAIVDTAFSWADTAPILNELAEATKPVIFLYHDRANADHMKVMYRGMCETLSFRCRQGALHKAVKKLLSDSASKLVCGGLMLDIDRHIATMDGQKLTLTSQEFSLLQTLMESPNTAISREDLLRNAWGYLSIGETRTVDVHVQRLRRKIGAACIETVYRTGYRLTMA